jgi:glutamate carboxypeptidase
VHGGLGRPPMEPTSGNRRLLRTAQRLGRELGLSLAGAGRVGGGSDANTTSAYTATLDGLGPCGGGDHAVDEHVSVSSLIERTALLAMLLLEPAPRRQPVGCRSGKPASARAMSSVETTPTGSPE